MANKGNGQINLDRESIGAFATLTRALKNSTQNNYDNISKSVNYLTDDSNVSGGDTEKFKSIIRAVSSTFMEVNNKLGAAEKAVLGVCDQLHISYQSRDVNLAEAQQEMGKKLMQLKQVK